MKETKALLLKLQALDDKIDALRAEEESIPEKKKQLEDELRAVETGLEEAKSESVELAKRRKELEIELDGSTQEKDKFKSQLYMVKSNREYEALQHEINALEEKGSALEDKILEILDKSEQVSGRISEEKANLEAVGKKVTQEQAKLDQELNEIAGKIALKDDERKRLVAGLDAVLLKRYERIRESKGGVAVTTVENGACGGCFRRIPPHEMQNLKKDDRIITCEGCGRILLWRWE
jgi:hypothetical protein